jgi:hypothetical protein
MNSTTIPYPEEFPTLVDSTMISNFRACQRQFHRGFVMGLAPASPSIHLHAGAVYAFGLETLRKEFYGRGTPLDECIRLAFDAMVKEWGDFEAPEGHVKSFDRVVEAFLSYIERYPPATDPIKPLMVRGEPAVEFTFAIPIEGTAHPVTGQPILYGGRFDFLGEFNGALYVVDDKTASQLGATWGRQWDLRGQFTGYCWAAREYGFNAAGAVVRGTAFLKNSITHAEAITYRPQWMIDEWLVALRSTILRMQECYASGYWEPDLADACSAYGGCTFKELCTKARWEEWIDPTYVVRRWNPLAEDPTSSIDVPLFPRPTTETSA